MDNARDTLSRLLNLLADGRFHSQKCLSLALSLTPSSLEENLSQLLKNAFQLEKHDKKGYRLIGGLELLDEAKIREQLGSNNHPLQQLEILSIIDSTNSYLLKKRHSDQTIAVFAEQQIAGRGQFNRQWLSNPAKNIALSLLWQQPSNGPMQQLDGLSLAMGLAVVLALNDYGLTGAQVKWPNDIVFQGKKLAGILIETHCSTAGVYKPVIGIGLNLYPPSHDTTLNQEKITDLQAIQTKPIQRNKIAGLLLKHSLNVLTQFQRGGFLSLHKEWEKLDSLSNQPIRLKTNQATYLGTAHGVNALGQLCVSIKGQLSYFSHGEASLSNND